MATDPTAGFWTTVRELRHHPRLLAALAVTGLVAVLLPAAALAGAEPLIQRGLLALLVVAVLASLAIVARHRSAPEPPPRRVEVKTGGPGALARLDAGRKDLVRSALRLAAEDVAETLGVAPELVRSNVFVIDDSRWMTIPEGLAWNMNRPEELGVRIPLGFGSTGRCFLRGKENFAVFHEGSFG
ncbi:MAG TPA: hypothetical protein VNX21_01860, partial [Candidatus Thermoplasmatota archaeon]|nr:hypothetical protein [Candidatus Thermoplasmatota archaeon]